MPDECDLDCNGSGTPDDCEGCPAGCYCGGGCYECCDNSHCTDPDEPRCGIDFTAHQCVECVDDDDCSGIKPYCLEPQGICYYCQTPQCPMGPGSE